MCVEEHRKVDMEAVQSLLIVPPFVLSRDGRIIMIGWLCCSPYMKDFGGGCRCCVYQTHTRSEVSCSGAHYADWIETQKHKQRRAYTY